MADRSKVMGIKQVIHLEWVNKLTDLILAGFDEKACRQEMFNVIMTSKSNAISEQSCRTTVGIIISIWFPSDSIVKEYRDRALEALRSNPKERFLIQWCMIIVTYPVWFQVSRQVGRLLRLQDQITQSQVVSRIVDIYGDKEPVHRKTRYVVRSLINWGVLHESEKLGKYVLGEKHNLEHLKHIGLLIEATIMLSPDRKLPLDILRNEPALFPFVLPAMNSQSIQVNHERVEIYRYGADEVLLQLRS
jgi:hypothetical protein